MKNGKPVFKKGTPEQIEMRTAIDNSVRNLPMRFEIIKIHAKEDRHRFNCLIAEGFSIDQALFLVRG